MFVEVVSRCRACTLGFLRCLPRHEVGSSGSLTWAIFDFRFSIVCSRGQEECNIDESNLMNEIEDSFTIINY